MDARFCARCGHVFSAPPSRLPIPPQWLNARVRGIPIYAIASAAVVGVLLLCVALFALMSRSNPRTTPTASAAQIIESTRTPSPTPSAIPRATLTALPSATAPPTTAPSTPVPPPSPLPTFDADAARLRALRATVRIIVPLDGSRTQSVRGSGSVLTKRGYILTNNHLFYDDDGQPYNSQFLAYIAFPERSHLEGDAEIQYRAVLVENDAARDLALLRITARGNGGALPTDLGLDVLPVAESDIVRHGHDLNIVGYPGIGGDSLTLTSGKVSGFIESEGWIKTDAEINKGNSGGPALNDRYELIGVASAASQAKEVIGKLGLVRPIRFARALIARAKRESGE